MDRKNQNLYYIKILMGVINFIILSFLSAVFILTLNKINCDFGARNFLENITYLPNEPVTSTVLIFIAFFLLLGIIEIRRKQRKRQQVSVILYAAEILLCLIIIKFVYVNYNGIILLVIADIVTDIKDKHTRGIFFVIMGMIYLFSDYDIISMFIDMISFQQFLSVYPAKVSMMIQGTRNILVALNAIAFIAYMIILMRNQMKENARIGLLNLQLQTANIRLKEMNEQPKTIRDTISPRIKDGRIVIDELGMSDEEIRNISRIHIVACGSAYHVAMAAKYVLEDMTQVPVEIDIASEFRYRNPILVKNSLVVIISQSGETADSLAALREAKQKGAKVLGIVNVVGSSIAREADSVMYTWAGPEIAVATTKGYTTQMSVLYLIALYFAKVRGTMTEAAYTAAVKELHDLPEKTAEVLKVDARMAEIAKKYAKCENAFIIGRGLDYAVAMESSLKLKEISYIHSEAYAAGELKHGTISLIEDGTLVVAIATQESLLEKTVSNVKEVKARGAKVLAIAAEDCTAIEDVADEVVYLPKVNHLFTASYDVLPMQLFAYYIAVERGCDVDKPRNLAKSVTVE